MPYRVPKPLADGRWVSIRAAGVCAWSAEIDGLLDHPCYVDLTLSGSMLRIAPVDAAHPRARMVRRYSGMTAPQVAASADLRLGGLFPSGAAVRADAAVADGALQADLAHTTAWMAQDIIDRRNQMRQKREAKREQWRREDEQQQLRDSVPAPDLP